MKQFTRVKFGVVELNHMSCSETGRVFGQLPLDGTDPAKVYENGMWLTYDKAAGKVRAPKAGEHPGLVYTTEDFYTADKRGLNNFSMKAGDYPRIGMFAIGDIYTSNTFCYDESDYANEEAISTALGAGTPVYVIPDATGIPKVTKAKPANGMYGVVVKMYTVPNGDPGLQVQMVEV